MPEVWLVVDGEVDSTVELVAASPATAAMVAALKQAIATDPAYLKLWSKNHLPADDSPKNLIICPLTLDLPPNFSFAYQTIYKNCRQVEFLRYLVNQNFGYDTQSGNFWLPIVLTQKGPIYAEVIGLAREFSRELIEKDLSDPALSYHQPVHLSDTMRQQIYEMGYNLLTFLNAPPATYLIQFGWQGQGIWFDRVWPFPAAPAIASINVQTPDLFLCHWYCLTNQPILDLTINDWGLGTRD